MHEKFAMLHVLVTKLSEYMYDIFSIPETRDFWLISKNAYLKSIE